MSSILKENAYIQSFGHIVISTLELKIVAISANLSALTGDEHCYKLGGRLEDFINSCFSESAPEIQKAIYEIASFQAPRKLILHEIEGVVYYISIYVFENKLYMEWEHQQNKAIQASEMNEIGFLFEQNHHDLWTSLCLSIRQLLDFDRVAILQIQETGKSQIIAESCSIALPASLGKHFAESFMPSHVIRNYTERAYMYVPDIHLEYQALETIETVDLAPCLFRRLPDEHRYYMAETGL